MEEARLVVDEIAINRQDYQHRLEGYNNYPATTFPDIQRVLRLLEERISQRLAMTMFAALGELEVETIRERVEAGLDYARKHGTKSGKAIGRPKLVFSRDEVRALYAGGKSIREIGQQLGLSRGTVSRTLAEAA